MRIILDNNNYHYDSSLGGYIECEEFGACQEYDDTHVPANYDDIEDWFNNCDCKNAYKLIDGTLVLDTSKEEILQEKYDLDSEANRLVSYKEISNITNLIKSDTADNYLRSTSTSSKMGVVTDSNKYASTYIELIPNEDITGTIQVKFNNGNLLTNEATSKTESGINFNVNLDRSIKINGTTTEIVEYDIAGTSSNTKPLMCFKKNENYYLSGLNDITLKMYNYDGTDRAEVYSGTGGSICFTDNDKLVTQITLYIDPAEPRVIQERENLSSKTLHLNFPNNLYTEIDNDILPGFDMAILETENYYIKEYSEMFSMSVGRSVKIQNKQTGETPYSSILYYSDGEEYGGVINLSEYTLPADFGTVTNINPQLSAYQYIKSVQTCNLDQTIKPMLNLGTTAEDYIMYEGNETTIILDENTLYVGDNIKIEDGTPILQNEMYIGNTMIIGNNLIIGGNLIGLNSCIMPLTYLDKTYMYSYKDVNIIVEYPNVTKNNDLLGYETPNGGFGINVDGNMYCTNAIVSGDITSSNAHITGGNIDIKEEELGTSNFSISCPDGIERGYGATFNSYGVNFNVHNDPYMEFNADIKDGVLYFDAHNSSLLLDHMNTDYTGNSLLYKLGERNIIQANYYGVTLYNASLEEYKKNIVKCDLGLDLIKDTDIYTYNYKNEDESHKKHIGVIIGDKYNTPKELLNNENDGIDTYSMVSVCVNAIKEQQAQIEILQNKIKEMESGK